MSDIPRARIELEHLASRLPGHFQAELLGIVDSLLYRDPPVRKAPVKHKQLTPRMKRQIVILAARHPDMHMDEIARQVGTNLGRVSEVLNGKR